MILQRNELCAWILWLVTYILLIYFLFSFDNITFASHQSCNNNSFLHWGQWRFKNRFCITGSQNQKLVCLVKVPTVLHACFLHQHCGLIQAMKQQLKVEALLTDMNIWIFGILDSCWWLFGCALSWSCPGGLGCFHEGISYYPAQRSQPQCVLHLEEPI